MGYQYFNKTVPNLNQLPPRMSKWLEQYGDASKYLRIYARPAENFLRKAHENLNYSVFQPTKNGGYTETFPFYRFWLDRYCECYELILWNTVCAQGGKNAEKYADEAVRKFQKQMQ